MTCGTTAGGGSPDPCRGIQVAGVAPRPSHHGILAHLWYRGLGSQEMLRRRAPVGASLSGESVTREKAARHRPGEPGLSSGSSLPQAALHAPVTTGSIPTCCPETPETEESRSGPSARSYAGSSPWGPCNSFSVTGTVPLLPRPPLTWQMRCRHCRRTSVLSSPSLAFLSSST